MGWRSTGYPFTQPKSAQWCQEQGRDKPGTKQTFGRDLRAACPGLKVTQPRHGDERERAYQGIRIKY
jgi:putative DNA primase/helicase